MIRLLLVLLLLLAPAGVWASVPVIATSSYNELSDDTARTIKPSGTASGDLVVLICGHDRVNPGAGQWATPTGFTLIKEKASNGADVDLVAYYKVAGGSEPDSYLVYTGSTAITNGMWAFRITGQHATPLDAVAGGSDVVANTITDTAITTLGDSCLVFATGLFDGEDGGPIDNTSGTGWASVAAGEDEWGAAGAGAAFVYDTKSMALKGSTVDCVIDWAGTVSDGIVGFQFAIRGLDSTPRDEKFAIHSPSKVVVVHSVGKPGLKQSP
jgi:hypothetical protein